MNCPMDSPPPIHRTQTLDAQRIESLYRLYDRTWPPSAAEQRHTVQQRYQLGAGQCVANLHFFFEQDGDIIAHARVFQRQMKVDQLSQTVACLADVCVAPEQRGNGLGRQLMLTIIQSLAHGACQQLLFQTNETGFYQKLGAGVVTARCFDSRNDQPTPWWEASVMTIPANSPLARATVIDLMGPGY